MSKLGRLRKDTLKDIRRDESKSVWKSPGKVFEHSGNKVLILSDYDGNCALCPEPVKIGEFVWFDSTKPPGRKIVHRDCWTPPE